MKRTVKARLWMGANGKLSRVMSETIWTSGGRKVGCTITYDDGKPAKRKGSPRRPKAVRCPTCKLDMNVQPNSKPNPCPQCGQGRGRKPKRKAVKK